MFDSVDRENKNVIASAVIIHNMGCRNGKKSGVSPWLRWQGGDPPPTQFELWYDNPRSLAMKAEFAWSAGAGGVSMWIANSLDYDNASQVAAFWDALTAGMPAGSSKPGGQDADGAATVKFL